MGRLFALAGPSGVGKTTFLAEMESLSGSAARFNIVPRVTLRARRPGERDNLDYVFYEREAFLQRLYAGDFIHVEEWGGSIYAIERLGIADALSGRQDSIIMAGIYGAVALARAFPSTTIIYMHTGQRRTLTDPGVLDPQSPELIELRWRLLKKIAAGVLVPPTGTQPDDLAESRLKRSLVELAFVNGIIRSGQRVFVLENLRDKMPETIGNFSKIVSMASDLHHS